MDTRQWPLVAMLALAALGPAHGQPLRPMDTAEVDPAMLQDVYGVWRIEDEAGAKTCRVRLGPEPTIGGSEIEVMPGCVETFPEMEDISAWRLMEGWGIALVDPLRKIRVLFTTPDERYVATPETDGIFTIVKE